MISREPVAGQLQTDIREEGLYFFQFGFRTRGSATGEDAVIGFGGILGHNAMKEKDDLLREVCYITTGLWCDKGEIYQNWVTRGDQFRDERIESACNSSGVYRPL